MRGAKKAALAVLCLAICVVVAYSLVNLIKEKAAQDSGTSVVETKQSETDENGDLVEKTDKVQEESIQENVKKIKMKLYFASSDGSAIPYEEREVSVKDGAVLKAAVEALLEGPHDSNLRKALSEGTRLKSINRKDNVAIVDFSKEYNNFGGSMAEIGARVSVVNTLTEFKGIEKVRILVEGKDLIGPSGKPLGELSRVALDDKGYPIPGVSKTITLYFGNDDADKVVAQKREVWVNEGESLEKVIIDELIKGPSGKELHPVIAKGTKLLSVTTKDGLCTLDFSHEFVDNHPGGSAGEAITINSIVNSLTELPQVKKVKFLIEGKSREVFIHVIFDEPFARNEAMIEK